MDQDTAFRYDDINKMISYIKWNDKDKVAIYSANTEDYYGTMEIEKVTLAITSGNIVRCSVIQEIGGFDNALFIDWVDHDICYRLINAGYEIIRLNKIKINHHLGVLDVKRLFGFNISYTTHSDVRYYYMTRNKFYVLKKNNKSFYEIIRFILGTINMIIKVLLLECHKLNKAKLISKGIVDALLVNMGKYK